MIKERAEERRLVLICGPRRADLVEPGSLAFIGSFNQLLHSFVLLDGFTLLVTLCEKLG